MMKLSVKVGRSSTATGAEQTLQIDVSRNDPVALHAESHALPIPRRPGVSSCTGACNGDSMPKMEEARVSRTQ